MIALFKKTMTKTKSFVACALLASTVSAAVAPAALAGGSDVLIDMSTSMAKTVAGKAVSELFFPTTGIDYSRIRADMAEVAREALTQATLSQVEGFTNSSMVQAKSIMKQPGIDASYKFEKLDLLRQHMGRDIDGITEGQFAKPGLAHFVTVGQTELSTIAFMKGLARESKDSSREAYASGVLVERLQFRINHSVATKKAVLQDRFNERAAQVGDCWFQRQNPRHPYGPEYAFRDNGTGRVWEFIPGEFNCQMARQDVMNQVGGAARAAADKKISWIDSVVAEWTKTLKTLETEKLL